MRLASNYILIFLLAIACSGLEDVEVNEERKVVIDGYIEQDQYPIVYLTYSSGFYEPVDSTSLQELVLTTARVEVSDGVNTEVLTLFRNTEIYPPFYYRGTDLKGEAGKTYSLEVISKDGIYSGTTSIPAPTEIDSIWIEPMADNEPFGELWMSFEDDPIQENFYRTFIKVRGEHSKYYPSYHSSIQDRNFNGTLFEFPIYKSPNSTLHIENDILFQKGDTITVRFSAIDINHFEFWRTLEQELYLVGNPFGSSGNEIKSNLSGNKPVLGIWGGYGSVYKTIVFE
jgi:hypothetical protein